MWQQDTAPMTMNWQQALRYCNDLGVAGYSDWRLPNVRELQSIVNYGRRHPVTIPLFETALNWYWSSTSIIPNGPNDTPYSWTVSFDDGNVTLAESKATPYYVRAVRGGL
jgi:hypothetical protein